MTPIDELLKVLLLESGKQKYDEDGSERYDVVEAGNVEGVRPSGEIDARS